MRIILKKGTAETVLCDGVVDAVNKSCGPTFERGSSRLMSQIAAFLRGAAVKPINRGNMSVPYTFGVSRECESFQDAEVWPWQHLKTMLRDGTLILIMEGSGGAITPITLSNALVETVEWERDGVHLAITYTITGGAIV